MTREDFVTAAREWIGTRWVHGQAKKGVGADCVGFIISLGKEAGWIPQNYTPPVYSSQWSLHRDASILVAEIAKFCTFVSRGTSPEAGDIILYRYARTPGHAGIYTGAATVIHGDIVRRMIREVPERDLTLHRISVWRPQWEI